MEKKTLWIAAGLGLAMTSVLIPLSPVGAAPPASKQEVQVTNAAANPVPVTGTVNVGGAVTVTGSVNVGSVASPVAVVPSMPAATKTVGIPRQSLTAGSSYTFLGAGYAMKASSITVWADHPAQFEFGGGMTVVTDGPMSIPLAQPVTTGPSVTVTCFSTGPSCYFQFWLVGS